MALQWLCSKNHTKRHWGFTLVSGEGDFSLSGGGAGTTCLHGGCHLVPNWDRSPSWKNKVSPCLCNMSLSYSFLAVRRDDTSLFIMVWSMLRCCMCHCFRDVSYPNSKQMSRTSTSCLVVCPQPLRAFIFHSYHYLCWHSKVWPCIFRGPLKSRLWVVLLSFQCQRFFLCGILGVLQRCDHKLAVLTKVDFEHSAFF